MMEKNMETTLVKYSMYWGYIGILENVGGFALMRQRRMVFVARAIGANHYLSRMRLKY